MYNHTPFSTIPKSPFVNTTPYAQRNQQYTDSTRNKGEGMAVAALRRAAALRRERQAAERMLAKLEALEGAK